MIFEHDMIPQVHEMMCNVHHRLPLDAYPCVMKRHSRLFAPLQCAKCVIIGLCYGFFLFIAVIISRVVHVIVLRGRGSVENRVGSCVPSAVANVETTKESDLLIDYHHFGMVAPQADTVTRVPHHFDVRVESGQIFLSDQAVESDCKTRLLPMDDVNFDTSHCSLIKQAV